MLITSNRKISSKVVLILWVAITFGLNTSALAVSSDANSSTINTAELPQAALLGWAEQALVTTFNYDYKNYEAAQKNASRYYTADAWEKYSRALESSGNLAAVQEKKLQVLAVVGEGKISEQGVINGRYSWKIEIPVKLIYQNTANSLGVHEQNSIVTLTVIKILPSIDPQGIAINSLVIAEKK